MRKFFSLLFLFFAATFAFAQTTQTGYVKTKGRMDSKGNLIPGTRIGGVSIQLTGGHSTVADANGNFTLTAPDKKFYLSDVQKQGYVLTDPDMLKKQYTCSSNPLVISMETKEKLADDQLAAERKLRRQLQKQLQQKEDEIEALKEENKITEDEYRQALQRLYAEQQSNEKLVSEMAKRYAEIDYDLLDEFYRQVSFCIENGDLVKADSLLRSRGDVSQQIKDAQKKAQALNEEKEKLQRAEAVLASDIEELGRRCYGFYEKFASQFENDSAAYYLELRANLDTTNVDWLIAAGKFISEYLADYHKTLTYYNRALRQARSQHGEKHPEVARVCSNIGVIYMNLGDYEQAMEYHQRAMDIRKSVYGDHHQDVAVSYITIGVLNSRLGQFDQALAYLQKALEIYKSVYGEQHIDVAMAYFNIGAVYAAQGDLVKALENLHIALPIQIAVYGENHPNVAMSYNNFGFLYSFLGDFDQSLMYLQKALNIWEVAYGENHPHTAMSYKALGILYEQQGEFTQALEYYQKSLNILKSIFGENHPDAATIYTSMGEAHLALGNIDQALEYFQKALPLQILVYGEIHPEVAIIYNNISSVYSERGDYAKSMEYIQKALSIMKSLGLEDDPTTKQIEGNVELLQKMMMAQDADAMTQYVFTFTFDEDSNHGFKGEYVVLECENWSIDSPKSLYDIVNEMNDGPATVLMMKDKVISKYTFEEGMDIPIDLKKVGEKSKSRIIELYHKNRH